MGFVEDGATGEVDACAVDGPTGESNTWVLDGATGELDVWAVEVGATGEAGACWWAVDVELSVRFLVVRKMVVASSAAIFSSRRLMVKSLFAS